MASRLNLSHPFEGMSFIYNVSAPVGWIPNKCKNNPDDVQLVQFLLLENLKRMANFAGGVWDFPFPNGTMDSVTGFWIFIQQKSSGGNLMIDGVISPATGVSFGAHEWTIVDINSDYLRYYGDAAFENIPNNPQLSASLRRSLQGDSPFNP